MGWPRSKSPLKLREPNRGSTPCQIASEWLSLEGALGTVMLSPGYHHEIELNHLKTT